MWTEEANRKGSQIFASQIFHTRARARAHTHPHTQLHTEEVKGSQIFFTRGAKSALVDGFTALPTDVEVFFLFFFVGFAALGQKGVLSRLTRWICRPRFIFPSWFGDLNVHIYFFIFFHFLLGG